MSQDFLPLKSEIPAICLVYKNMSPVRQEPGDKFSLIFNNIPIPFFALSLRFFELFSFSDIKDRPPHTSDCAIAAFHLALCTNYPDGSVREDDTPLFLIRGSLILCFGYRCNKIRLIIRVKQGNQFFKAWLPLAFFTPVNTEGFISPDNLSGIRVI